MEDRNEMEKMDEVLLPGFRFHPTDEELVTFYLRKKIQQKPLAVELIRQLDIYKFDPWDLPKMAASTGDKEWYFYCPRGRKYRNSLRPNRVTVAGFWKATGTDRPIYSSEGTKCIGLKKSLVFYRGRAAKGTKTDWMMHEFRLPSLNNNIKALPSFGNNIDQNDSWAICKIFQKTTSLAQRELNQSVTHPLPCDNFAIPNTQSVDAKNQNCYPVVDFASYSSSSVQINFAHKVYGGDDVQKDTENTKLVQLEETDSLGNGEEYAEAMKSSSTLYGTNDQLQITESVEEFPFNFSWESPSCPSVDTTMSWTERNSYNSFD